VAKHPSPSTPSIQRFYSAVASLAQEFEGVDDCDLDAPFASAFMSDTPFPPPRNPIEEEMSKDAMVEGLLTHFNAKVPEVVIPISQVDPTKKPQTIKQAMDTPYAKYWAEAIVNEWFSIVGNNTWVLVDQKPWMKVIPCKWILDIKIDEENVPYRFKARLVAGGHRQLKA
jgi:hypothetical protein